MADSSREFAERPQETETRETWTPPAASIDGRPSNRRSRLRIAVLLVVVVVAVVAAEAVYLYFHGPSTAGV